jgi:hypothetical protein
MSRFFFRPVEDAPLALWREPEDGEKYSIGIDTSTGVATDWTVMQVLSRSLPFEQVARFRAKWSVVDSAAFANSLGRYYNEALIVCETNYPGNAVQDALVMTYRYPHNYQAEERLDEDPGISTKFGFQTTEASKWLLIREFQKALASEDIILNDRTTVEELGSFVYKEDKSKTGAIEGLNDDCVMAIMLAYRGAMLYPEKFRPKRKESPVADDIAQQKAMMDKFNEVLRSHDPAEKLLIM